MPDDDKKTTETGDDVAKALADARAEIERLRAHSAKVLAEKKALQAALKAAPTDDDTDDTPAPKKKAPADDDTTPVKKARERIESEVAEQLKALKQQLDQERKSREGLTIETAFAAELAKVNVAEPLRKAAAAMLKAGWAIEVSGHAVMADGKPLADAVATWANSEGKAFVAPPTNSGSAAPGRPGSATAPTSRAKMSQAEKAAYIKAHGLAEYQKLAS